MKMLAGLEVDFANVLTGPFADIANKAKEMLAAREKGDTLSLNEFKARLLALNMESTMVKSAVRHESNIIRAAILVHDLGIDGRERSESTRTVLAAPAGAGKS